jgi:hypothetical protein
MDNANGGPGKLTVTLLCRRKKKGAVLLNVNLLLEIIKP